MLYYVHGYMSEPDSTKGILLKEKLNAIPIKYRDCPPEDLVISDCVERIVEKIKNDDDVILIGSSLGGLLAVKTAKICKNVKKLILLNPAIIPGDVDVTTIHDMPLRILNEMKDPCLFEEKINADIDIIVGTLDNVVPNGWSINFAKHQQAIIHFLCDDHRLTKNINQLPDIIQSIIGRKH